MPSFLPAVKLSLSQPHNGACNTARMLYYPVPGRPGHYDKRRAPSARCRRANIYFMFSSQRLQRVQAHRCRVTINRVRRRDFGRRDACHCRTTSVICTRETSLYALARSPYDNGSSFIFPDGAKIPVKVGQCSRLKCFLVGHSS
jgi:hypothetical protein